MSKAIAILQVTGKTSDMCSIAAYGKTDDGGDAFLGEYSGYVPKFFPGKHWGDYLELEIDVTTGQILNWPKDLSQETIRKDLKLDAKPEEAA